jgi:hypothetical protein
VCHKVTEIINRQRRAAYAAARAGEDPAAARTVLDPHAATLVVGRPLPGPGDSGLGGGSSDRRGKKKKKGQETGGWTLPGRTTTTATVTRTRSASGTTTQAAVNPADGDIVSGFIVDEQADIATAGAEHLNDFGMPEVGSGGQVGRQVPGGGQQPQFHPSFAPGTMPGAMPGMNLDSTYSLNWTNLQEGS